MLALRLYSTAAFRLLNAPLRDLARYESGEAHPLPITVAFIADAVRRLRAVGGAHADTPMCLYRGLSDSFVPPEFMLRGGTEVKPRPLSSYS